jgi:pyruvate,orthophosphate dikinase
MLGLRGVRLGITVPEIYDMQARAIFEAAVESAGQGAPVVPEVMIPLVSARREVEIVKARVDAVAAAVRGETGVRLRLPPRRDGRDAPRRPSRRRDRPARGVPVLRDERLTQMTYGLSRDDAGRFLGAYVGQGVFEEDPFHSLDLDGVANSSRWGRSAGALRGPKWCSPSAASTPDLAARSSSAVSRALFTCRARRSASPLRDFPPLRSPWRGL